MEPPNYREQYALHGARCRDCVSYRDQACQKYHPNEIDDGHNVTTDGASGTTEAGLDTFLNGEAISNNDVVIWYAAHVTHDVAAEPPGTYGHITGPTLKPVNW
jgi:Cu2+-containing amine oxidase